jgi:hypothetical protein
MAMLEARLRNVENVTQRNAGSVGRADALLVAFASRRAIDRGVPLGYLETLLAERFGGQNPVAVATIITCAIFATATGIVSISPMLQIKRHAIIAGIVVANAFPPNPIPAKM